jgi:beta-lactamase regulating signal transducer with metallopeptidase domain
MLTWMVYVVTVSVFLCGAAFAAEYQARLRRTATRWIWIAVIVASLLIPTVIASVSVQMPGMFDVAISPKVVAVREVTTSRLSPARWLEADTMYQVKVRSWDPILRRAWLVASGLMLAALVASGVMLFRRIRTWRLVTLAGTQVYVADNVGPAVVGLLRSRIVVPAWLLSAPESQQAAVIAHEQSHLEAGDPLMLTIALGLLVLMPWNFPLWWQLRRLRRAIEVDCDTRVLRSGIDRKSYGETLLDVGVRQSGYIGSVAAMSESSSFLEQRIKLIMNTSTKRWQLLGAALGLVSLALFAVAAEVSPPNAGSDANPVEAKVPAAVLNEYVGYYRFGDNLVMHITRQGDQVYSQMTGQLAVEIYPSSSTEFFYKIVKARIDFVTDGSGPATALILHQNGAEHTMPRIDAALAQQLEAQVKARVDAQTPAPGSEAAVRLMIEGHESNNPPYSRMSPELAKAVREQLPRSSGVFKQLGPVKSIQFKGVGTMGWDSYEVKFENGTMQYRINMSEDGTTIVGALMTMSP